jgi:hypothetical protein
MRISTAKGMRNSRWDPALALTSLALSSLAAGITITGKSSFERRRGRQCRPELAMRGYPWRPAISIMTECLPHD